MQTPKKREKKKIKKLLVSNWSSFRCTHHMFIEEMLRQSGCHPGMTFLVIEIYCMCCLKTIEQLASTNFVLFIFKRPNCLLPNTITTTTTKKYAMTKLPFKPRLKNINTKASRSFYYGHKMKRKKSLLHQFFFLISRVIWLFYYI